MALPDGSIRMDLGFGLLALVLLTAPLWAGAVGVGDDEYGYERAEVVVDGDGLEYESDEPRAHTPISEDVECAGSRYDIRICSLEEQLLDDVTIRTSLYTSNPARGDPPSVLSAGYYEYVQTDDGIYEVAYEANESAPRDDGMYPVELALELAAPDEVLERVSIDVDAASLPSVIAETARDGPTTAGEEVDVPETPIHVDGSYYRVSQAYGPATPPWWESALSTVLTFGAPLFGLLLVGTVSRRIEITYVGDE